MKTLSKLGLMILAMMTWIIPQVQSGISGSRIFLKLKNYKKTIEGTLHGQDTYDRMTRK